MRDALGNALRPRVLGDLGQHGGDRLSNAPWGDAVNCEEVRTSKEGGEPTLTYYVKEKLSEVKEEPEIDVEVRQPSEGEKLYYELAKAILRKHIIKTFYVSTPRGESELGIYCYDGLVYRPCEIKILSELERLASVNEYLDSKTTSWIKREALRKIKDKTLTVLRYEPLKIAFKNTIFDWEAFFSDWRYKIVDVSAKPGYSNISQNSPQARCGESGGAGEEEGVGGVEEGGTG